MARVGNERASFPGKPKPLLLRIGVVTTHVRARPRAYFCGAPNVEHLEFGAVSATEQTV